MITKLKNHPGFMKYFANTSWLFAEKILRMGLGLFVGVWVARYLGAEQFGLFNYALAFIGMFGFLVALGLDGEILVRELNTHPQNTPKILATALFMKMIGAIMAINVIAVTIRIIEHNPLTIALVTIASFTYLFRAFSVFESYFQSKVLARYVVYSSLIALVVISIVKVVLILMHAGLIWFVYSVIADVAVTSLFLLYFYIKKSEGFQSWHIDIHYGQKLLSMAWPVMISSFLISIYMQIDIVMIKNMLGDAATGNYAAATRISTLFYFIPVAITSSVFPAILNAKKRDEQLYYGRFAQLFNFSVIFMLPVAFIITLISDQIIALLYTDAYESAAAVLSIHIWAVVFVFFNNIQWKWYITENLQKLALVRISIATFINILLNLYLIPQYGVKGAAIATLISFIFAGYLGNLLFGKSRRIFLMQTKALLLFPAIINFKRSKTDD